MKSLYCQPHCEIVRLKTEYTMLVGSTGRESEVGGSSSTNTGSDHYTDPTGPITGQDGGESLGKKFGSWSDIEY